MNCRNITCMPADGNSAALFYFLLSKRIDRFLVVWQNIYEYCPKISLADAFFKDMNFSEPFQIVALGLLSYIAVRIKNHMLIFLSYFHFNQAFLWI